MVKWSLTEKIVVRRVLREMERLATAGSDALDNVPHPLSGQFDATPANAVRGWVNGCAERWGVSLAMAPTPQEVREAAKGPGRVKARGIGR